MSTFAVSISGAFDQFERRTALAWIADENIKRAAAVPPIAALSTSTAAEIKSSLETIMSVVAADVFKSRIAEYDVATLNEIRELWPSATDQKRAAAVAALR